MEIILGKERRRWSEDEKRALVAETFVADETVNGVARRHGVNPSMLFCWRKQYREVLGFSAPASTPMAFAPVAIAPPGPCEPALASASPTGVPTIELEFRRGTRMRICGTVDPGLVAAVLKAMTRR